MLFVVKQQNSFSLTILGSGQWEKISYSACPFVVLCDSWYSKATNPIRLRSGRWQKSVKRTGKKPGNPDESEWREQANENDLNFQAVVLGRCF